LIFVFYGPININKVHPGESPSSYVMDGILDYLLDKNNKVAKELLKYFVFKIVPMLNPDGVYHGHYRLDRLA